jgi:hypothetical protein
MKSRIFSLNKSGLKYAFAGAVIGLPIGDYIGTLNKVAIDIDAMHDYLLNYGVMTSDVNSRAAQLALIHDRRAFKSGDVVYYNNRKLSYSTNMDYAVPFVLTVATTAALGVATRRFGLFAKKAISLIQEKYSINNRK